MEDNPTYWFNKMESTVKPFKCKGCEFCDVYFDKIECSYNGKSGCVKYIHQQDKGECDE